MAILGSSQGPSSDLKGSNRSRSGSFSSASQSASLISSTNSSSPLISITGSSSSFCSSRSLVRPCFHHVLHIFWKRKKSYLLALVLISGFILMAIQYTTVNNTVPGSRTKNPAIPDLLNSQQSNQQQQHQTASSQQQQASSTFPRRNLSALNNNNINNNGDSHLKSHLINNNLNRIDQGMASYDREAGGAAAGGNHPAAGAAGGGGEEHGMEYSRLEADHQQQQHQQPQQHNVYFNEQQDGGSMQPEYKRARYGQEGGQEGQSREGTREDAFIPAHRLFHLDLKGAPPKVSYLKQIMPLIKEAGGTGILLEYEDTFPYWGTLKPVVAGNAYTEADLQAILELAKIHQMEVIPLVQTFGHMEPFLKLQEFRHLREVDEHPEALCPSKNDSFHLVTQVIDQVLTIHPTAKWLHIGCDEVFHMGYCDKCRLKDRDTLFLQHVTRVAKYVREKHNVIPIIWDDMLRNIPSDRIKESGLGELAELMVWVYVKDIYRFIPYSTWMAFAEVFPNVWGASAFKGAFGETLTIPNAKWHLENNEAWLQVFQEQHRSFKSVRGLVVTGWSRYDHMGALCELLPSGLPSLILDLLTLKNGRFDNSLIFTRFNQIMGCTSSSFFSRTDVDLESDQWLYQHAGACEFPGAPVFRLTQQLSEAIKRVNDYLYDVTIHKAWLTDYNVRHNFSSPMRIDSLMEEYSSVYYPLTSLVRTAKESLSQVYDDYTVSEWIEQNIYPYLLKMEKVMNEGIQLKRARVWPRRPLPPLEDLKRFGL